MRRHLPVGGQRAVWILMGMAVLGVAAGVLRAADTQGADQKAEARKILDSAGIKGGLVVHLGSGDGRLTAALHAGDGYLVQGLEADAQKVAQARRYVQSLGLYGPVSIDRFHGKRLPYVDNLVNLVVAGDLASVPMEEVMRVLAPGGVAYLKIGGEWKKTVKPRPAGIDEWTHYLHDSTNNAVSADSVVGPPRQLQWVGNPPWTRSHDHLASVSAAVCAGGRLFYIVDDGPIAAVVLQPKWELVACDAFSGVVLWKRPIPLWQYHLRGFRSGPTDLARRLVAVGDRVYVTLGSDSPLSVLDAATGRTIRTYEGTDHALEVIYHEGTLFVVAGQTVAEEEKAQPPGRRPGFVFVRSQRPVYPEIQPRKRILAIEAESGRLLWKKADAEAAEVMPTTLAAAGRRVFFQNADGLVCLDAASGKPLWRAPRPTARIRPSWSAPTLVVYHDVVLSADRLAGKPNAESASSEEDVRGLLRGVIGNPNAESLTRAERALLRQAADRGIEIPSADAAARGRKVAWFVNSGGGQAPWGELIAFSAQDGRRLWSCPCREGYNSPVDVLVAGGLVWTGNQVEARNPGITEGRDPETGEVKRTRPRDQQFFNPGMGHHRCYRDKATCRYLVQGRSGVEFVDLTTGEPVPNHWTRGGCQYGVIPCNGLLYVPPHSCACFITAKLNGFNCLAPRKAEVGGRRSEVGGQRSEGGAEGRLERGPAYVGHVSNVPSGHGHVENVPHNTSADWPTYRHDPARSGRAGCAVADGLKPAWQVHLGGRLSSIVVAEGKLLVAQIDAHTVHALDARDGHRLWSSTAGARIDSPPTVWQGRVLFGSADGWVYCLRASDGALAWRFRAAPEDERIVSYGQLESAWPVPGNVLAEDGVACCVAGRSSYLDGGIRLCRLDAATGRLLSETVIDYRDPKTGFQANASIRGTDMPGALPDVLSCDGNSLFLRHLRFDLSGRAERPNVPHLFSAAGFLDDSWWHRTYWLVGTVMASNYGGWPIVGSRVPAGRLLALDGPTVYGFGRNQYSHTGSHIGIDSATVFHYNPAAYNPHQTHYQAFAISRDAPLVRQQAKSPAKQKNAQPPARPEGKPRAKGQPKPKAKSRRPAGPPKKNYRWTQPLPILARAMVLAGDRLLLAGPPDIFRAEDPVAAIEGRSDGALIVLSAADGKPVAEYRLKRPPVFDGMAAAGGAVFMATTGGKVLCLRAEER